MFQGFSGEALDFLAGIRANNNKEWFEAHKGIYTEQVYEPLKELAQLLYEPYSEIPDMMAKAARIYKDASFPPFLHYRDTMWIYVRHEAMYWSKSPTLFFELSPEGVSCGFRIAKPDAAFMALLRQELLADAATFLQLVKALEKDGITIGGEEYKRAKPCPEESLLPYFKKKSLSAEVHITDRKLIGSALLTEAVHEVFAKVFPLHEYLQDLYIRSEIQKAAKKLELLPPDEEPSMAPAPKEEFMW